MLAEKGSYHHLTAKNMVKVATSSEISHLMINCIIWWIKYHKYQDFKTGATNTSIREGILIQKNTILHRGINLPIHFFLVSCRCTAISVYLIAMKITWKPFSLANLILHLPIFEKNDKFGKLISYYHISKNLSFHGEVLLFLSS